jgi:hypothetical protein
MDSKDFKINIIFLFNILNLNLIFYKYNIYKLVFKLNSIYKNLKKTNKIL